MTINWYSINISLVPGGDSIFDGYFKTEVNEAGVDTITEFYYQNNFQEDILGPIDTDIAGWADGNYSFPPSGVDDGFDTRGGVTITKFPYYTDVIGDASRYFNLAGKTEVWLSLEYEDGSLPPVDEQVPETVSMSFQLLTSDPSCFNEGTKILCLNKNLEEEYIPIENLRKGDLVKSYKHGYRKIDLIGKNIMINNPNKFNECMYKMEKTEENGLIEDLIVTGGHGILVHDLAEYKEENDKIFGKTVMIDDKYLLLSAVSKEFLKLENTNLYTFYHFILENNGNDDERFGVWANGILTETPSKFEFNYHKHKYTLL